MGEPFSVVGLVTGLAANILSTKLFKDGLSRAEREKEIRAATTVALDNVMDLFDLCADDDFESQSRIESFWANPVVGQEIWACLCDVDDFERVPDFVRLHDTYQALYGNTGVDEETFHRMMEGFWVQLVRAIRTSSNWEHLRIKYKDKMDFLGEDYVYPQEGREMILKYCGQAVAKGFVDREIYEKFKPSGFSNEFSEEILKNEFFDYHPTGLTALAHPDHPDSTAAKESTLAWQEFWRIEKVILFADGGMGKSRFLLEGRKHLTHEVAAGIMAPILPIFLEARKFRGSTDPFIPQLVETELKRCFKECGLSFSAKKITGFVRYLFRNQRLFFLIDAFDQMRADHLVILCDVARNRALLGDCPCVFSTRPYMLSTLLGGENGIGSDNYQLVRLEPFSGSEELERYFKGYTGQLGRLVEQVGERRSLPREVGRERRDINMIQIPLFAGLIKTMAMQEQFGGSDRPMTRTELLDTFVTFRLAKQVEKDLSKGEKPIKRRNQYDMMLTALEELSLRTLEKGHVYTITKKDALKILGPHFPDNIELMEESEFLRTFMQYEGPRCIQQKEHQYQHQLLQEYFAARGLFGLYNTNRVIEAPLTVSLAKIMYDVTPEVGRFLAEMIAADPKDPARECRDWHDLLCREEADDWVRTYAMEIRDRLAEVHEAAQDVMVGIYQREAEEMSQQDDADNMVLVKRGVFLQGSYEYHAEWPVRLVEMKDDYFIGVFPVTNLEFCDFLNASHSEREKIQDGSGNSIINLESSNIRVGDNGFAPQKNFVRHPVTHVSWYGARAYCDWLSEIKGGVYRLPTEEQWERAARGWSGRRYPWGSSYKDNRCNIAQEHDGTTIVGNFPKGVSPAGCHDLSGNVWEWTCTDYDSRISCEEFAYDIERRKLWESEGPVKREQYVSLLKEKGGVMPVLRGGSWFDFRDWARCASRDWYGPDVWDDIVGFRCARVMK